MLNREQDRKYLLLGLRIVGEFGAIIAVPVVVLALLGGHLDRRYETAPALLIVGFVLAAVFSGISVYRRAKLFGREYMEIESEDKVTGPRPSDADRRH